MKLLQGKVALITGASRGIGKAIAEAFADQGATVAFTYLSSVEKAKLVEDDLRSRGVEAVGYQADAANLAAITAVVDDVVKRFGRIDAIVNNAGITQDTLLLRMTEEHWDKVIQTNLNSVFYTTKASMKYMLKQRSGSYINISSVVGVQGNAGQANYAASKAGMIGFSKSVAREVGSRGIRSNVVAPGFIETEMTAGLPKEELDKWLTNVPLQRAGQGTDVANLCVFLASDMSTYITGQVLNVDGGMVMA